MRHISLWFIILVCLAACEQPVRPYEQFKKVIQPGMERATAIKQLQKSAWYYQECRRQGYIEDLFFFGSHQYNEAEILIVDSIPKDDRWVVREIGTFEPYAWHTAYADCIQRDRFEG